MTYSKSSPHQKEKNISRIFIKTPIGWVKIEAIEGQIVSVNRASHQRSEEIVSRGDSQVLKKAASELKEYFSGKRRKFSVPLFYGGKYSGTPFQQKVWHEMAKIPYGKTVSYAELAQRVGRPRAARAVGQACNRNRNLILVPCHRVVASGGGLGGFALGIQAKCELLERERC